jgi:uncharacterized membrane protein
MLWTDKKLAELPSKNGFRLRGIETTRLDTFVDAAFAFATTMLVISVGDIPNNYNELIEALKGIPAFAMSFSSIMIFWLGHRRWSRRYGIEDSRTLFLSLALIFIMLVYVYPLKLMFSAMAGWMSQGYLPSEFKLHRSVEMVYLFVIYGFGFAGLTLMMLLLQWYSMHKKKELRLNAMELTVTRGEIVFWAILSLTGFLSAMFAWLMPVRIGIFAGFIYFNLPVSMNLAAFRLMQNVKKTQE